VFRALYRELGAGVQVAPDLGWSRFAERVSVCIVPAVHMDLVRAPQATQVAAEWQASLQGTPVRTLQQEATP
jgi:thioesterase domain-containing protein